MRNEPVRQNLVEELKQEHKEIMEMISRIASVSARNEDVSQLVEVLRIKCTKHLEKEDLTVYPVLKEAARSDLSLQKALAGFLDKNREIHQIIDTLFKDWDQTGTLDKSRIDTLLVEIWPRMLNEELLLFNEYARLRTSLQR